MNDLPVDPYVAFEEAMRVARAATHEHKLERPVAVAFAAIIAAGHAAVDAMRVQQRELVSLRYAVNTLKMGATSHGWASPLERAEKLPPIDP